MTREITSVSFRRSVFREYNNRCYVCGFSVPQVLRVHHLVPVSLGGVDTLENLVLLCSNCHALVHVFSSERFSGKNIHKLLEVEYSGEEIDRIGELAYKIRQAKHNIQRSNNLWSAKNLSSRRPYSICEALDSVSVRNSYAHDKMKQLQAVFELVMDYIPQELKMKCSYRLLKGGRYISINVMNYLLYRSPGYGDLGGPPKYDCFLIFPGSAKETFKQFEEKTIFKFRHFDGVNLGLSFEEILAFSTHEWAYFSTGCEIAAQARPSRDWISNIEFSKSGEK